MTVSTLVDFTADQGKVVISWSTGGEHNDADWIGYRIYHQSEEDALDWTLVYETRTGASSYSVDVYQYSNAITQRFTVVKLYFEASTSRVLEGTYGDDIEFSPASTDADYWLVHPTTPSLSIKLELVVSDDFSDEWERTEMILLGRGRKVNLGARLGRVGKLEITLRDSAQGTARSKRKELTDLYGTGEPVWLRDPFGDLVKVSLGKA